MKIRHGLSILLLAVLGSACENATAPEVEPEGPVTSAVAAAQAPSHISAAGLFTQTAINGLEVRPAGPNTILEQTSEGTVSGTLSGSFEDDLRVVIHPGGNFNAHFTITCQCTVEGKAGVLELVAGDTGELVGPNTGVFAGRAVIKGGTGELSGLRGVLQIEGTVDVPTGLSSYAYSGRLRWRP